MVGNHCRPGNANTAPQPVTLQDYLRSIGTYGNYAGLDSSTNLFSPETDKIVTIRFQTFFLPDGESEFCTNTFSYNTRSENNPCNMLLLCTSQGTSVQQDCRKAQSLFFHTVDSAGLVHRHWIAAEQSTHKVGGAQNEDKNEADAAAALGKATAQPIGIKAMGNRFNVQMFVQIPIKQDLEQPSYTGKKMVGAEPMIGGGPPLVGGYPFDMVGGGPPLIGSSVKVDYYTFRNLQLGIRRPVIGEANAARVSRGAEQDIWGGVKKRTVERDHSKHVTVTVTTIYKVKNGVPSTEDIMRAYEDLIHLYDSCTSYKNLSEAKEVTAELTVKDAIDVLAKKV